MRNPSTRVNKLLLVVASSAFLWLGGCANEALEQSDIVSLTGMQEVPPVSTSAKGTGQIMVLPDRSVSGTITTAGMVATAAHIHTAAAGTNGPVIIPLIKTSDNAWIVPAGVKLTETQYAAYQAGGLYVNVHSAGNPGGEIRGQLMPAQVAQPASRSSY